jgi:hypothetical protein
VRQGMRDGAFGLSTGLFYVPGAFTPTSEVVELQKVVGPFRGVHTSHIRDEATGVVKSVNEAIAIGEQSGVPTHVSHHKIVGRVNWGKSMDTLSLIDALSVEHRPAGSGVRSGARMPSRRPCGRPWYVFAWSGRPPRISGLATRLLAYMLYLGNTSMLPAAPGPRRGSTDASATP